MRAQIRAGDPDAFRELFNEHVRLIYNHAYRLTGDWSRAEEVASLTFLEAWRLRERLNPDEDAGPVRAWLLGIATNVARNVRRAARRYDGVLARLPRPEDVADFAEDVADRVADEERLALAVAALGTLRKQEREVVALVVWSGLDNTEAAEALGIPPGTVRSRLSRARKRLAKAVADAGSAPAEVVREHSPRREQLRGDRATAVRPAQEVTR